MPSVNIGGVPVMHSLSPSKLKKVRARIDAAHTATRARFDALDAAIKLGDHQAQRGHLAWLTTDSTALLSHAVRANPRMRPTERVSLEACLAVPEQAILDKPIAEPVAMYAKPKSGGFRVIHEFGIVHRAIQLGVRQTGSRYFAPRSFQYSHRGVPDAIRAVRGALLNGLVHVAEIDIKQFFSSYREDRLLNEFTIPTAVEWPEGVVTHAVFSRHYEAKWKKGGLYHVSPELFPFLNQEARSGLSTGSGCSSIIAMITVSKLAWPAVPDVFLVNYLDNFLLLASSDASLGLAISELTVAIEQLPGGHFVAKKVFRRHASEGFDFLGHRLRQDGEAVHVAPTQGNFHDFCSECNRLDTKMARCFFFPTHLNPARGLKLAMDQIDYVRGFIAAFAECDTLELDFYKAQISNIISTLKTAGLSRPHIAKALRDRGAARLQHYVYQ